MDGSSKGGTTGWGAVVLTKGDGIRDRRAEALVQLWGYSGKGTNNTAELEGGIGAMKWLLSEGGGPAQRGQLRRVAIEWRNATSRENARGEREQGEVAREARGRHG